MPTGHAERIDNCSTRRADLFNSFGYYALQAVRLAGLLMATARVGRKAVVVVLPFLSNPTLLPNDRDRCRFNTHCPP